MLPDTCKAEVEALTIAGVTSKPLGPVLKALRDRSKGNDKAEAQKLIEAVRQQVQRQLAVAERNRATNPLLYQRVLERLQIQLGTIMDWSHGCAPLRPIDVAPVGALPR